MIVNHVYYPWATASSRRPVYRGDMSSPSWRGHFYIGVMCQVLRDRVSSESHQRHSQMWCFRYSPIREATKRGVSGFYMIKAMHEVGLQFPSSLFFLPRKLHLSGDLVWGNVLWPCMRLCQPQSWSDWKWNSYHCFDGPGPESWQTNAFTTKPTWLLSSHKNAMFVNNVLFQLLCCCSSILLP